MRGEDLRRWHALIHPLIKTIANVGYLINGAVYRGDSALVVPSACVRIPSEPIRPWSEGSVIDFVIATGAQRNGSD